MKKFSRFFLFASFIYALGVIVFIASSQSNIAKAATNNSTVVISQIQIAGVTANDEFVEFYNPTNTSIALTGWRLGRKIASKVATDSADILVASMSGTVAPRKYLLVTSNESPASISADLLYSNKTIHITPDNAVILYSDAGHTVVDKVGMGTALDSEISDTLNPAANQSVIRKASATSTAVTLGLGGSESTFGNGFDTDNNSSDFVLLQASRPRTNASPAAQPTPTPTTLPTPTATPTLEPTMTPIPTEIPTPTAIPTVTLLGTVYIDANQNGVQDNGETGYNGATLSLDSGQTTTTDSNGTYVFSNLTIGSYSEILTVPGGFMTTTTNPATLPLTSDTTENFGIAPVPTDIPTPTVTPTPTVIPTLEPTMTPLPTSTPTPTTTPTPTIAPTATPMPTATPTTQPTATPTEIPIPTLKPTATPTVTPVPTLTIAPTIMPTAIPTIPTIPTPTPIPNSHHKEHREHRLHFYWRQIHYKVDIFGHHFSLPGIHCGFTRD